MKPLSDRPQNQTISTVGTDPDAMQGEHCPDPVSERTDVFARNADADPARVDSAKQLADLDLLRAYGCLDGLLYPDANPDREPPRGRVSSTSK
jgi:hypothetical protein